MANPYQIKEKLNKNKTTGPVYMKGPNPTQQSVRLKRKRDLESTDSDSDICSSHMLSY